MLSDFYQFIDEIGLNLTVILFAGLACSLVVLFASREIFAWFSKTNEVNLRMNRISAQLESIEAKLNDMAPVNVPEESQSFARSSQSKNQSKNQFELNH